MGIAQPQVPRGRQADPSLPQKLHRYARINRIRDFSSGSLGWLHFPRQRTGVPANTLARMVLW
jgi:hypothetical protein